MNNTAKNIIDIVLALVAYAAVQILVMAAFRAFLGDKLSPALLLVLPMTVAAVLTIALFVAVKWTPVSRRYVATRPWASLAWVAVAAVGVSAASSILLDVLGLDLPEEYARQFTVIMSHDYGYLAIGLLVPVAEEFLFRGAVLRCMLNLSGERLHWVAIALSAVVFGAMHGNAAQGLNAFAVGLLLGWMYWRTRSVVPGIVLHWVNNTVAYAAFVLIPGSADKSIVDLAGGGRRAVVVLTICALCVLIPALYQLSMRLGKQRVR